MYKITHNTTSDNTLPIPTQYTNFFVGSPPIDILSSFFHHHHHIKHNQQDSTSYYIVIQYYKPSKISYGNNHLL